MERTFIPAEIIDRREGYVVVKLLDGFAEPELIVSAELLPREPRPIPALIQFAIVATGLSLLLGTVGCGATRGTPIEVIGQPKPVTIQREGVGRLVTIEASGWTWHRKPKEVVSELVRALNEQGQIMIAERDARVACEAKLPKPKEAPKAAKK